MLGSWTTSATDGGLVPARVARQRSLLVVAGEAVRVDDVGVLAGCRDERVEARTWVRPFGRPSGRLDVLHAYERTERVLLAIAGTGFGLIGILVIILLVVLILYFVRRV